MAGTCGKARALSVHLVWIWCEFGVNLVWGGRRQTVLNMCRMVAMTAGFCSERGVRLAPKVQVGPCIPVGIQL
jgi:hypothetical protein